MPVLGDEIIGVPLNDGLPRDADASLAMAGEAGARKTTPTSIPLLARRGIQGEVD